MRKPRSSFIAAGLIGLGAIAFAFAPPVARAQQSDSNKPSAGQAVGNAIDKAVNKTEAAMKLEASDDPAKNAENIKSVIAQVTDAALTKSGLDDVVERFSKSDRERLDQNKDALKNNTELDGRIAEFQKDWKMKYNQDFKISDKDAVFNNEFAMISQGSEARTASDKILPGDKALEETKNDRDFATVKIPASHDKPEITVPFVFETGGWRIDVPDSVDANKLRDNVQNALTKCDEMKDKWPADVNDAYRAVAHSVLIAVMDQKGEQASAGEQPGSAQPAASKIPADQGTTSSK